jgi:hypothetical protein
MTSSTLLNQPSKCVVCDKSYQTIDSTAHPMNILIYCSLECETISDAELAEGNKILNQALANDPHCFTRTKMNNEEVMQINTLKKMGVKFEN